MKIQNVSAFVLASFMLSGCITTSNLNKNSTLDKAANDTIIVLGVQPRYRVAIGRGVITEGQIKLSNGGFATLNVFPENGYIVGRVPAASFPDEYHIALILPEGIGGFTPRYSPCGEEKAISFSASPGKVVYVGTVNFLQAANQMKIDYLMDLDGARQFLDREYPQFASRLEGQTAMTFPIAGSNCAPTHLTIPIFIRGAR